jgi:hypothetical protein
MKFKFFLLTLIFSINLQANNAEFLKLLEELFQTSALQKAEINEQPKTEEPEVPQKSYKDKVEKMSTQHFNEFIAHINKYYPKVFVIREKFLCYMTPQGVAKAYEQIIQIISERPWFYVEQLFKPMIKNLNSQEKIEWNKSGHNLDLIIEKFKNKKLKKINFENGFENFIADQLVYFHNFLKRAKVDVKNNLVFYEENRFSYNSFANRKKTNTNEIPLKKYWQDNAINIHFDFYELCADYWSRIFINSISNNQLNKAYRYFDDFKEILSNLRNSPQESKVNEYAQKYKEVTKLLKQKKLIFKKDDKYDELFEYWGY